MIEDNIDRIIADKKILSKMEDNVKIKYMELKKLEETNKLALKPIVDPLLELSENAKLKKKRNRLKKQENEQKKKKIESVENNNEYEFVSGVEDLPSKQEIKVLSPVKNEVDINEELKPYSEDEEAEEMEVYGDAIDEDDDEDEDLNSSRVIPVGGKILGDKQFGIWSLPENPTEYFIGKDKEHEVKLEDDHVEIMGTEYILTNGLWTLLFIPKITSDLDLFNASDLRSYKKILEATDAHKNKLGRLKSSKNTKYLNIIRPLFAEEKKGGRYFSQKRKKPRNRSTTATIPVTDNEKVDYVFWDDPNELVKRLEKLHASRLAGNTALDPEIFSIEEELREAGIIG